MEFERINHNKIKVTLSPDDLDEWDIDFDSLSYNSIETQEMFWSLMKQAEIETGFYIDESQLIIEAMPLDSEDFVIMITRIDEEDDFESIHKYIKSKFKKSELRVKKKNKKIGSNLLVYIFSEFDHVCYACKRLSNIYFGHSTLYKYKSSYYLILRKEPIIDNSFQELEVLLMEYGKQVKHPNVQEGFLNEYGVQIIENDAVNILNTHF